MPNAPAFAFLDEEHCEVAFGKGNCFKATDGNWYAKSALLTEIAPSNAPTLDLNPVSLVKSALGDLSGPISTVEKWVLKQLVKLTSLVSTDLEKAKGYAESLLSPLSNALGWLITEVHGWINEAIAPLKSTWDTVSNNVVGWLHDAAHYADDAINRFHRTVVDPLATLIQTDQHNLRSGADTTWQDFLNGPYAALHNVGHDAQRVAHDAEYWVDHAGHDMKVLLDGCWEWLEWLGKNSIHDVESLPAKMLSMLTATELEQKGATVTSGWSGLLADLERKFPDKEETEL
jgi:hypothetical protein